MNNFLKKINPAPSNGVLDPAGRISLIPLHPRSKLRGIRGRCGINPYLLLFFALIIIFLSLKIPFVTYKFSDENIYFYMGKLLTEGVVPYRDFFFASPPLQILIIALLIKIGASIFVLKLLPILLTAISAFFIFYMVRKKFGHLKALFASLFYLFSFVILTTTDYSSGVHLTSFFILTSYFSQEKNRNFLAGIFAALSLLTRLYAGFAIIGILIYLLIKERKKFFSFLSGLLTLFILVNLLLILFFKTNYLEPVFFYHLLKTEGIEKARVFKFFFRFDLVLIVFAFLSIFTDKIKKLFIPLSVSISLFLFYIFFKDIYYLYFTLVIPFLATLAGVTALEVIRVWLPSKKAVILSLVIILLLLVSMASYNSYAYLKDHAKTAKITFAKELSRYIKEKSGPRDTIYGSYEITPLISLLSERKITYNFIDTNDKTFMTGLVNLEQREREIKGKVKFILTKVLINKEGRILEMGRFISLNFLKENCQIVKTYPIEKDYFSNMVLVWQCQTTD